MVLYPLKLNKSLLACLSKVRLRYQVTDVNVHNLKEMSRHLLCMCALSVSEPSLTTCFHAT